MATTYSLSGIYKHSGQYLKNVVTDNKKTKDLPLIKNSGTLVIYSPVGGNTISGPYNELYLGDTFLAGGYGFNEISKEILQNWVDEDVINSLSGSLESLSGIVKDNYDELSAAIDTKVSITGGDISNTVLFFIDEYGNKWPEGNTGILTSDFLQYNSPAVYNDLSISNITKSVTIYNNIDDSINTFGPDENGKIYVPIGGIVKSINIRIDGNSNDSGGLTGPLMTLYYNHILRDNVIQKTDGGIVASIKSYLISPTGPNESTEFTYNIIGSYNERKHYIINTGENQMLFDDISCTVQGSTKLLDYPLIKEKFNISIKSPQNKIIDHKIKIDSDVTVEGRHVYYYNYVNTPYDQTSLRNYINGGFIHDLIELDLSYDEDNKNKYILLLFPVNYEITKIELFDKKTNMVHNISGGVRHYENENILKGISQISYSTISYHTEMRYDIYEIYRSEYFNSNIRLLIYTQERSPLVYDSNYKLMSGVYNDPALNLITDSSLSYVIDDDYNSFHWVHYSLNDGIKYLEESYESIS